MKKLKIGIIGLGGRGYSMTATLNHMKDVEILAVCDSYKDRAERGGKLTKRHDPLVTTDYHDVINMKEIEAVMIFTSWEDHIPLAIEAMRAGKDVGMEVGGAYRLQDCFDLVKTAEETKKQCMMLENCCYGRYELMVKRLADEGKMGTIVHCEGGYCHDLRGEIAFGDEHRHYRLRNYLSRNCENYPTHELGPIAKILKINDGNRMVSLTSAASKACGLHEYFVKKRPDNKELVEAEVKQGDVVTTTIKCENGETIVLTLNTTLPGIYSRKFTVNGTQGMYREDGDVLVLEGAHPRGIIRGEFKMTGKRQVRRYEHPIWKAYRKELKKGGHGGIDYLVLRAFVTGLLENRYLPIDVYDTAAWMAVTPLSEESIKNNSAPVEFPDFTHGMYKNRTERNGGKYDLS